MNNPIQSFWHGPELSVMEHLCLHSYLAHGHEFHLYVYEQSGTYPEGVVLKDASEIIPYSEAFVDCFGGFVNFSNRFRYALLYQRGGWWVDMTRYASVPWPFRALCLFLRVHGGTESGQYHLHKEPSRCLLPQRLSGFYVPPRTTKPALGRTGSEPPLRMIFRNGLEPYIHPPLTFCPVSGLEFERLISSPAVELPDEAYALHWFHELWRRRGLDKSGRFPDGSLYENLKTQYLPEYPLNPILP